MILLLFMSEHVVFRFKKEQWMSLYYPSLAMVAKCQKVNFSSRETKRKGGEKNVGPALG